MTAETFLRTAIDPVFSLLPARLESVEARAMLVSIALQESRLLYRRQLGGPAHGYVQFEKGGIAGVLSHSASSESAMQLCEALDIAPTVQSVYEAIEYQDVLCAGFARLLLWTSPLALPAANDPQRGWELYLDLWRPGKPHRVTWDVFYRHAWEAVTGRPTEPVVKV